MCIKIYILSEDLRTYIHQYDEMIVLIDLLLDIYLELPLGGVLTPPSLPKLVQFFD